MQHFTASWMREMKGAAVKRQSMKPKVLPKNAVMLTFAVAHVANDRVSHMFEVFADLMGAPCLPDRFEKAVSLEAAQECKARSCWLLRAVFVREGMVHDALGEAARRRPRAAKAPPPEHICP